MLILGLPVETWNAFTAIANAGLTLGLLVFAGMQWWVTHKAEESRREERFQDKTDERERRDQELDRAFQTVWAEHLRIEALADYWDEHDFVTLSALGVLRASDLLPRNWTTIMEALGVLGRESAFLGAVAVALAHDAEREVAALNAIVGGYTRQYPDKSPDEIANLVRHNRGNDVLILEKNIKKLARDLANMMWDAARQSPRADVPRELKFHDDMYSDYARAAVEALKKREPNPLVPIEGKAPNAG